MKKILMLVVVLINFNAYSNQDSTSRSETLAERAYLCASVSIDLAAAHADAALDMQDCLTHGKFQVKFIPEATVRVTGRVLLNTPSGYKTAQTCNFVFNGSVFSPQNLIQDVICE